MTSTDRQDISFVISAIGILAGIAIVLDQVPTWAIGRATGRDDMLGLTIAGILLTTSALAVLAGAFLDLPTRGLVALGAAGYVVGIPVSVVVLTVITQSWGPMIGVTASALLVALIACTAMKS